MSKNRKKRQRQAALAKAKAALPTNTVANLKNKTPQTAQTHPPLIRNTSITCYEVSFKVFENKILKNVHQYFHQPKGRCQAILDALKFLYQYSKIKTIEQFSVFEWIIGLPQPSGDITTKQIDTPLFEWNCKNKITVITNIEITKKQKRRIQVAAVQLDSYCPPMRTKVVIEEIGLELNS